VWTLLVSHVEVDVWAPEATGPERPKKGCGRIRLNDLFYLRVVLRSRIASWHRCDTRIQI
jgi:hypothetical protein